MDRGHASPEAPSAGPELVIGLVGALGADLDALHRSLAQQLEGVGYAVELIRLSEILGEIDGWEDLSTPLAQEPLDARIASHQVAGNQLRRRSGAPDALAILSLGKIQTLRSARTGDRRKPAPRTAYVLRSLKRREEVETLRRVYGPYFLLLAAYSPRGARERELSARIAQSHQSTRADDFRATAQQLIQRDDHEPDSFGQGVRDAFPLADAFFAVHQRENLNAQVERLVAILFGHPFVTPTREEFGMFQAKAAALRSADLSRQVGAAITTRSGDVIAVGTNEVPRAGGGLYWPGDDGDARDFQTGRNASLEMRKTTLAEILAVLVGKGALDLARLGAANVSGASQALLPDLRDSQLMSLGEFGRTVHAEMTALTDALRHGVSTVGATLYSTTFPCHNCTRHIIAAGIDRVVYVEPYPKSHAEALHRDAITVDESARAEGRVAFQPFVGVSPQRYLELFAAAERRDGDGAPKVWRPRDARPRSAETWTAPTYPAAEDQRLLDLKTRLERAGLRYV
jgi:cytidine deaminase